MPACTASFMDGRAFLSPLLCPIARRSFRYAARVSYDLGFAPGAPEGHLAPGGNGAPEGRVAAADSTPPSANVWQRLVHRAGQLLGPVDAVLTDSYGEAGRSDYC
jgi:hypothetical protein